MKKTVILLIFTLLLAYACNQTDPGINSDKAKEQIDAVEKNRQFAAIYHDLKAENIDVIFTEDFIGRGENGHTWDRESHRTYLSNGRFKVDSIHLQVVEGDWVATMFTRTMLYRGDTISVPIMHFKRFEENLIAELWEYYDFKEEE